MQSNYSILCVTKVIWQDKTPVWKDKVWINLGFNFKRKVSLWERIIQEIIQIRQKLNINCSLKYCIEQISDLNCIWYRYTLFANRLYLIFRYIWSDFPDTWFTSSLARSQYSGALKGGHRKFVYSWISPVGHKRLEKSKVSEGGLAPKPISYPWIRMNWWCLGI